MVVKKATPAKRARPVAGKDDITAWQDNQPVITVVRDSPDDGDYFPSGDEVTTPVREEVPPKIPSPVAVKVREAVGRVRGGMKPRAKSRVPKPRKSVDGLIGMVWQGLAQVVQPINLPVARVLDMQAPVAGMVLEDVVKDTVVDRILQPLARMESGGETVFALLGPPLLVAALTQRPGMAPLLVPMLRQSLMSWIEIAGPKLEAVKKKEAKFQAEYGQQIDEMIGYFLAPPMGVDPNATDASPNHAGTDYAGAATS